jgi:hypothetical protein
MRDVLNIMYGLPFGEHRGEDWNLVLSDFQHACDHLEISDINDHTYWVRLDSEAADYLGLDRLIEYIDGLTGTREESEHEFWYTADECGSCSESDDSWDDKCGNVLS